MAYVTRGRVVPQGEAQEAKSLPRETPSSALRGRIVPRAVLDAHRQADEVTERARARAYREARADVESELAAQFLALQQRQERSAEADLDRTVALAVMLAERLIGATLRVDRHRIVEMARAALAEARGARRVRIEACPLDAEELRSNLSAFGLPPECIDIQENPELASGSLSLHTDLGSLDARLSPQLERLATALRDALRE
ncbi:FliH/SctL family protein [Pendulispora albinea]|uniref:Flagellar assembly protein FliH n=1 Tax=Pendulispora albinea TaxID=2741071 RepID=A0ABZ2LUH9_9BACT